MNPEEPRVLLVFEPGSGSAEGVSGLSFSLCWSIKDLKALIQAALGSCGIGRDKCRSGPAVVSKGLGHGEVFGFQSPVQVARVLGHHEVVRMLLAAGAKDADEEASEEERKMAIVMAIAMQDYPRYGSDE